MTELLTKEELLDLAKRKFDLSIEFQTIDIGVELIGTPEWDANHDKHAKIRAEIAHINDVLAIHGIKQED